MPDGSSGIARREIATTRQWAEALSEIESMCQGEVGPAERTRMQNLMQAVRAYEETWVVATPGVR